VIERHVVFQVVPDKSKEFEEFFRSEYALAMARQPGFCGAELLRPGEPGDERVMVLRFDSLEAAQAWRESAEHKRLSPKLKSLYRNSEVRVFEVVGEQPQA
jgi:heme-degrading monooxygenase HmoA